LSVERGELYGFLGPNGAGKTTTIRMALGLIHPTAGTIEVRGSRVTAGHGPFERVGALVEEPALWSCVSVRRNLEACGRAGGGGGTMISSSHLPAEGGGMCDRVGGMARGALVAEGPPGTLRGTTDRIRIEVDDVVAARTVLARLGGPDTIAAASASGPGVLDV